MSFPPEKISSMFLNFLKQHKKDVSVFIIIALSYFSTRLLFLMNLPIFNDEAIYIWWAKISENNLLLPVTLGRQPLFMWLIMLFTKFTSDPLLGARLISIVAGFISTIGLFLLTSELFKDKKTAFLTSILYIVYPFAVVYDRMAMIDTLIGTTSIWSLYLALLLIKKRRLLNVIFLVTTLTIGILSKTNAFFSIYLLPFSLIFVNLKKEKKYLLKIILLGFFAVLISQIIYSIIRFDPGYKRVLAVNGIFIYPIHDFVKLAPVFIVKNFLNNLFVFSSFLFQYLKLPYLFLIFFSLIFIKEKTKEKLLLLIYFLIPFLILCLFARVLFPRYIFFMTLFLLPLAGLSLTKIVKHLKLKISFIIIILFFIYPTFNCFQILLNFNQSDIPAIEIEQYGSKTGEIIKDSLGFFNNEAKNKKIFIGTEGVLGYLPNVLEIYLNNNKNIQIKGFDVSQTKNNIPKNVEQIAKTKPVYFVYLRSEKNLISKHSLKVVFEKREKINGENIYYRVYKFIPDNP